MMHHACLMSTKSGLLQWKKNFLKILHECESIAASVFASSWLIISLLHLSSLPLENATASNQGKMHINWKLKNCAFGLELRPRKASKKTMKTFDLIFSVTSIEWIKVWKAVQISSDPRTGSEKHEKLLVDITTLWNFNPPPPLPALRALFPTNVTWILKIFKATQGSQDSGLRALSEKCDLAFQSCNHRHPWQH